MIYTESMSIYIHKSHNVSVLIYHLICPTKYRKVVMTEKVDMVLKETCLALSNRYQIHFLIQSIPTYTPTKIARVVKSITAREIFARVPEVKQELWGGEFWSDGYYISTIGKHGSEKAVTTYVKNQGKEQEYIKFHQGQLALL